MCRSLCYPARAVHHLLGSRSLAFRLWGATHTQSAEISSQFTVVRVFVQERPALRCACPHSSLLTLFFLTFPCINFFPLLCSHTANAAGHTILHNSEAFWFVDGCHTERLAPFRSPVGNAMMATRRMQEESSDVLGKKVWLVLFMCLSRKHEKT